MTDKKTPMDILLSGDNRLKEFPYEEYLMQVEINSGDHNRNLAENGAFIAYYGAQEALWAGRVAAYKRMLGFREAEVEIEIRDSGDKITAPVAAAKVALDDKVNRIKTLLELAQQQTTLYKNACHAFDDRGQNARSISSRQKTELAQSHGNAPVEDREFSREDNRERAKRLASRG